ncbi:hypothetical protein N9S55_00690 [Candidatus Pelagibacter bacterium]|nr:hypothetical protein [Candidatus Pelagibacter bacterium]MDA9624888.1 hypothetical protein [Candidatus Pelagibacter bacterium]
MKKIISTLILFISITIIILISILSSIGIETNRFNNLISKKINQTNNNINLELTTIKFKLDIKEISLFLETNNPKIDYQDNIIPAKKLKVYIDFESLIKSEPKIKKISLDLNEIDIEQLKKISVLFKPSNLTSFLNNKIELGKLNIEIDIYLDDNNLLDNFIARGSVSDLKANIINNIDLDKTNFNFFADKTDILLKNILSETGPIKITDGDLKLKLSPEILIESNFKANLKYNRKLKDYKNLIKDFKYIKNIINLEANFNNTFFINFDKTYKVKKYNYNSNGQIKEANFYFDKNFENNFFEEKTNQLTIINSQIKTNFNSKKSNTSLSGKYLFNKSKPLQFNLENMIDGEQLKLTLDADYNQPINIELLNYKKTQEKIANLSLDLEKISDNVKIKKLNLIEENNSILIEDLKFNKNKFLSFKKILVQTNINGKTNNDFSILYGKKISIDGERFDASNLPKILNRKTKNNNFSQINKDIEINILNILAPLSENLKNFKLLGKIEKGKFTKISSKGDFGENNYLDISMKKDQKSEKKYLEIYSDLTKPLLTEYSFFKGLTGGKLLFSSIIDGDSASSKLKIENFKVINAPGMVKLLSLADLGGLADLAEGDGLSFDVLEIKMDKDKDHLKINEIIALGSSISVLMEGYQSRDITSLRGTLVPAKTLNKMISKIPVLGNIIIPKEVGEGLFGISFKIKGPPGNIKTTINPIRTLTPRFIQKIIDKNKNLK